MSLFRLTPEHRPVRAGEFAPKAVSAYQQGRLDEVKAQKAQQELKNLDLKFQSQEYLLPSTLTSQEAMNYQKVNFRRNPEDSIGGVDAAHSVMNISEDSRKQAAENLYGSAENAQSLLEHLSPENAQKEIRKLHQEAVRIERLRRNPQSEGAARGPQSDNPPTSYPEKEPAPQAQQAQMPQQSVIAVGDMKLKGKDNKPVQPKVIKELQLAQRAQPSGGGSQGQALDIVSSFYRNNPNIMSDAEMEMAKGRQSAESQALAGALRATVNMSEGEAERYIKTLTENLGQARAHRADELDAVGEFFKGIKADPKGKGNGNSELILKEAFKLHRDIVKRINEKTFKTSNSIAQDIINDYRNVSTMFSKANRPDLAQATYAAGEELFALKGIAPPSGYQWKDDTNKSKYILTRPQKSGGSSKGGSSKGSSKGAVEPKGNLSNFEKMILQKYKQNPNHPKLKKAYEMMKRQGKI